MAHEKMHHNDSGVSRATLSLSPDVYEKVRTLSHQMGLRPTSLMAMIISTHVNDVRVDIRTDHH